MASLRYWLRRAPQPTTIQVVTEDDEEKIIKLGSDARNRWKGAEQAVLTSNAIVVRCLDADGTILRAEELTKFVGDGEDSHGWKATDSVEAKVEKALIKERASIAAMLDRYGDRLNEAFERGAQAANVSQENLVQIVAVLSAHLSNAITNQHTIAANFANHIQESAGGQPSGNDALVMQVIAGAIQRYMATGAMPGGASATNGTSSTNGKTNGNGKKGGH